MKLINIDITVGGREKFDLRDSPGLIASILAMYNHFLKKPYETDGFQKVVIRLTTKPEEDYMLEPQINILVLSRLFDPVTYKNTDDFQKKMFMLNLMYEALIYLAEKRGWEKQPLIDAYNSCLERNLLYTAIYRNKQYQSPNKKHFASLFYHWGDKSFEAFAVFYDRKKIELHRKKLFECDSIDVDVFSFVGWDKEHPSRFGVKQTSPKREYWAELKDEVAISK